jgi:hypothetical protein
VNGRGTELKGVLALLCGLLAACSGASAAAPGTSWNEASVAQPASLVAPWASASIPAFCSPCHAGTATRMLAVASDGSHEVAVGMSFPPAYAAAWLSTDGQTWAQAPGLDAPEESIMTSVTVSPARIVAVGGIAARAAGWTSANGSAWSSSRVGQPSIQGQARMAAVVGWHGSYVAGGDVEPTPSEHHAVLWESNDGTSWTALPDAPQFDGGSVTGIAAGPSELVAVGYVLEPSGATRAAAWWSTDGRTWNASPDGGAFTDARMNAVAVGGPGFVAVGSADNMTSAAVWTSRDGRTWTRAPAGAGFSGGGLRVSMASVAAIPGDLVAVGSRDDAGNGSPTVWVSSDGTNWRRVADDPSFGGGDMSSISAAGTSFVAVGALGLPDNALAAAWTSVSH